MGVIYKLRQHFKAAIKHPIWDWGLAPLMWPFKWKRLPISLAFHLAVQPLTSTMFPTAEEYLEQHGIDPRVATELCDDTNVYVREKSFKSKLHAMGDEFPFWPRQILHFIGINSEIGMYATKGVLGETIYNSGRIYVGVPSDFDAKKSLTYRGIKKDQIENFPVTDEEMCWYITFHEIRHMDDDNGIEIPYFESDSDYQALKQHIKVFNNPEIINTVLYWRALGLKDDVHESCIYLDYKLKGKEVPHHALLLAALTEANAYLEKYVDEDDSRDKFIKNTEGCREALENHRSEMSIHAARRLELYIEATEYFAPSSVGVKPQIKTAITPALTN